MKQVAVRSSQKNPPSEYLRHVELKHRALDARVRELGRRVYLTQAEQVEATTLKKMRLRVKDELAKLTQERANF